MLSYSQAGQPIKKPLQVLKCETLNLAASYRYDNEGKMTSVNYPATYFGAGPTYTYSFDYLSYYQTPLSAWYSGLLLRPPIRSPPKGRLIARLRSGSGTW